MNDSKSTCQKSLKLFRKYFNHSFFSDNELLNLLQLFLTWFSIRFPTNHNTKIMMTSMIVFSDYVLMKECHDQYNLH